MKSIEVASTGYFGTHLSRQQLQSRRESLSLGTSGLHLSDSEDGDSKGTGSSSNMEAASAEGPRGVVKRVVTRRSNLLPKTKNFARIRAALMEEAAPIDSEVRREAEVIRQVHENDAMVKPVTSPILESSPHLGFTQEPVDTTSESNNLVHDASRESNQSSISSDSFSRHAARHSAGLGFWHAFDERYHTPPPSFLPRESSSALSDDNTMEAVNTPDARALQPQNQSRSRSRSVTPLAPYAAPSAGDVARKITNKRRREEDFDPGALKRRAVSPGLSVQSSPVLPQSPNVTGEKAWGRPPPKTGERSNSGGSVNGGMKRVGLQGMTETNDGLMNMSID